MKNLEQVLGYKFNDMTLLEQSLTHPSMDGQPHYQRLEFLGDRVLGLVVANWLFDEFPDDNEGEMSRRFIGLVRKETLSEVADKVGLAPYIKKKTAKAQGEAANSAIQADVVESIIAAIYKDGGLKEATKFIRNHFAPFVENITDVRDPKSALQEYAQGKGLNLPQYVVEKREGPDHNPVFHMKVEVEQVGEGKGTGFSKRDAEAQAATDLLDKINNG